MSTEKDFWYPTDRNGDRVYESKDYYTSRDVVSVGT